MVGNARSNDVQTTVGHIDKIDKTQPSLDNSNNYQIPHSRADIQDDKLEPRETNIEPKELPIKDVSRKLIDEGVEIANSGKKYQEQKTAKSDRRKNNISQLQEVPSSPFAAMNDSNEENPSRSSAKGSPTGSISPTKSPSGPDKENNRRFHSNEDRRLSTKNHHGNLKHEWYPHFKKFDSKSQILGRSMSRACSSVVADFGYSEDESIQEKLNTDIKAGRYSRENLQPASSQDQPLKDDQFRRSYARPRSSMGNYSGPNTNKNRTQSRRQSKRNEKNKRRYDSKHSSRRKGQKNDRRGRGNGSDVAKRSRRRKDRYSTGHDVHFN